MSNLNRKITILLHMQNYCEEISETFKFFGKNFETFESNAIFRNSISMPVFQICELSKLLDKEYHEYIDQTKDEVPWRAIIRMRERFAHHYIDMDNKIIFDTALNDIPILMEFISKEIKKEY